MESEKDRMGVLGKNRVENYMKELNYQDVAEFAEAAMRGAWPRGYYRWKVLKPVLRETGWDLSTDEGYTRFWARSISDRSNIQRDRAMQEMGLERISDIPTVGRVMKHIWDNYLCPTEIIEETPERCVARTLWCGNPFYGPSPYGRHDNIRSYMEYYRNVDAAMTRDGLLGLAIWAKKRGLKEDVEVEMPCAMCRDGDANCCLYIIRKKGSPKYTLPPLTDREKAWMMEDEIERSGEKPVVYVARMLGITIEEFAAKAFTLAISLDMGGLISYNSWEHDFGMEKALDMYKKYWLSLLFHWFREAKFELEIGKVTNLEEIAKVVVYCQKQKFVPYRVTGGDRQVTLIADIDPYAEIPTEVLGVKLGASYFDAVALADEAFVNKIILEAKVTDKIKATVQKRLVKGDTKNVISLEKI